MAKQCNCGELRQHALVVESAIFQSLLNAQAQPERENYWRGHADKLEGKFTTDHGMHYSEAVGLPKAT